MTANPNEITANLRALRDELARYSPNREEAMADRDPLAVGLHALSGCRCADPAHIDQAERLAADVRANTAAQYAPTVRYPVEAKVIAGGWGALAASLGLGLVTLLLDHLELIPGLVGGNAPWVGITVTLLGMVLPAVASVLTAYREKHTPRPTDALVVSRTRAL